MSVLDQLASSLGRRDEAPNQELARTLATAKDKKGIRKLAENLWNRDKNIQSDCIKVLYEIGALEPKLIADYADDFVKCLRSKNNRLVWGGMTALAEVGRAVSSTLNLKTVLDTIVARAVQLSGTIGGGIYE